MLRVGNFSPGGRACMCKLCFQQLPLLSELIEMHRFKTNEQLAKILQLQLWLEQKAAYTVVPKDLD